MFINTSSVLQKQKASNLIGPNAPVKKFLRRPSFLFQRGTRRQISSGTLDQAKIVDEVPVVHEISVLDDPDDEMKSHHSFRTWIRQAFGTVTMAISSSQILMAYVVEPDTLARSYLSFLITHGGIRGLNVMY